MKSEKGARKLLFKYKEDEILAEVMEYIAGTYSDCVYCITIHLRPADDRRD